MKGLTYWWDVINIKFADKLFVGELFVHELFGRERFMDEGRMVFVECACRAHGVCVAERRV